MKLHPPVPDIPKSQPFMNDLFGRKPFGDSLASLLSAVEESTVVCVDAAWGEGKTTFARMWIADLEQRGIRCVYYDAYEHDYCDDPFVSFCAEIISLSEDAFKGDPAIQTLKKDFKSRAKRVGAKLLRAGSRIGLKAATLGVLEDSDVDALAGIGRDLRGSDASAVVGRALDDYSSSKSAVAEFRSRLSRLGGAVRESQKFPLLVVVDELDRCRPDFALSLLERIKHLFATENVSFVLLANLRQIENYVQTVYGREVDARNYLQKFFALTAKLPRNVADRHDNDYAKYVFRLSQHYGVERNRESGRMLAGLFRHYGFSLREMERCFSRLALYYAQLPEGRLTLDAVVPLLAVLMFRHRAVFDDLSADRLSYAALVEATGLDRLEPSDRSEFPRDWLLETLKFLLISKEEFTSLPEDDPVRRGQNWLCRYSIGRRDVIPFLCAEMSKFAVPAAGPQAAP